jgi:outer membrane protein assembly factor BamB
MVTAVGLVFSVNPTSDVAEYGNGQLRPYPAEPGELWSLDLTSMQTYGEGDTPEVVGTFGDVWLVAYPSGLGNTYLAIDHRTGAQLWDRPIDAGLGSCAINGSGELGCALNLADQPDGFYLADLTTGELRDMSDDRDTHAVAGVGPDFLRVNGSGYQVTRNKPDGTQVWARTFAAAATVEVDDELVVISASDGSKHVIDPATGTDKFGCASCDLTVYPTGVALQFTDVGSPRVEFYNRGGTRTSVNEGQQLVSGPAVLAVTTGSGPEQVMQTQGAYSVYDPAQKDKLWQVTDPELSKVASRPCGSMVAFARKDGSRSILDLRSGDKLGNVPRPEPGQPGTNIDYLNCVGQGAGTAVFGNAGELTAFNIGDGSVAWQRSVVGGQAVIVDGYLVLEEGTTLSVLAPS